ncbi:MAG: HEAT repeat domain-containing protein [Pyrinomonadaceae bacterium]|nr:HEAT repeat domain-containing protein [Pyrinomonadaceae bacterium]
MLIPSGENFTGAVIDYQNNGGCSQIQPRLTNLRSTDKAQREAAKKEIVLFAGKSASSHECVVQRLLASAVVTSKGELMRSPERFLEWREVTELMVTLKVTEGFDILISCLDCSDGTSSLSLGRFPAASAMARFGEDAVPKLDQAVRNKNPMIRYKSAEVLHAIGGPKAREVVKQAVRREQVKWIAAQMRNLLLSWHGLSSTLPE